MAPGRRRGLGAALLTTSLALVGVALTPRAFSGARPRAGLSSRLLASHGPRFLSQRRALSTEAGILDGFGQVSLAVEAVGLDLDNLSELPTAEDDLGGGPLAGFVLWTMNFSNENLQTTENVFWFFTVVFTIVVAYFNIRKWKDDREKETAKTDESANRKAFPEKFMRAAPQRARGKSIGAAAGFAQVEDVDQAARSKLGARGVRGKISDNLKEAVELDAKAKESDMRRVLDVD